MGVKDLWPVLAPVCERKSLWDLQDKVIAIDLSCWVCDSQNVAEFGGQPNMYLRNLFFRTSALLLVGAVPIFVLEGQAPELKAAVIEQRKVARGLTQTQKSAGQPAKKGNRSRLKSIQKKCCEFLKCLGIKCVESPGEAEALCAVLNKSGLVAGCISQDSDCFLYGAETVYRNFSSTSGNSSTGGPGFSIDSYSMTAIEKCLGLTRNKLIALSLLCGCDYIQQGVAGVGKETALQFLSTVRDEEIFDRLRKWRGDSYYEQLEKERTVGGCEQCGHIGKKRTHAKEGCDVCRSDKGCTPSHNPYALCHMESEKRKIVVTELSIRKKALIDPDFPSEEIIDEFLTPGFSAPSKFSAKWDQPDVVGFLRLAGRHLNWDEVYAFNKFLPVLTRWMLVAKGAVPSKSLDSCPLFPAEIIKNRVLRGIPSYEIKWADSTGLFDSLAKTAQASETDIAAMFSTIEPQSLVKNAYPDLVHNYTVQVEEAKKAKRKGKSKSKKRTEEVTNENIKRCDVCEGSDGCLCRFTNAERKPDSNPKIGREVKKSKKRVLKEASQARLSPFVKRTQKKLEESLDEMFNSSLILADDQCDEADLSAIVLGIVGPEAYYQNLSPETADAKNRTESTTPKNRTEFTASEDRTESTAPKDRKEFGSSEAAMQCDSSDSSDQEFETRLPLIERIKRKAELARAQEFRSPVHKKSRVVEPYSPLIHQPSFDAPPPTERTSRISLSKAARRFSASWQAFSSPSLPVKASPPSSPSSHDSRFDLGVTEFLDGLDD